MRPDLFSKVAKTLSHPEQTKQFVSELAKKTGLADAKVTAVIAELGLNEVQNMGAAHDTNAKAADAPKADAPAQFLTSLRIGRSVIIC
jgi:hypothetical protein